MERIEKTCPEFFFLLSFKSIEIEWMIPIQRIFNPQQVSVSVFFCFLKISLLLKRKMFNHSHEQVTFDSY